MGENKQEALFIAGSRVRVEGVRSLGTIISGPDRKGMYEVAIGALSMKAHGAILALAPEEKKKKSASKFKPVSNNTEPERSIDLHGLTSVEAIERLETMLDAAVLDGTRRIEVIHGLGTGKLKAAVANYLSSCPYKVTVQHDTANPGRLWIHL